MINVKLEGNSFGARHVVLSTPKIKIETPSRAIISTETHYIDQIINSDRIKDKIFPPYPHEIYEVIRREHKKNFVLKDLKEPIVYQRKLTGLKNDLRFQKDAIKMFHYQKPNAFTEMTNKDNNILFNFQNDAGLGVIKVWDEKVNSNVKYFSGQLNKFMEHAERENSEILPVIEMANPDVDNFKEKLFEINDLGLNKLNVNGGSFFKDWKNYSALMEFAQDKDIWIHASGLSRKWKSDNTTSEMHLYQKFGINSFSLGIMNPFLREGCSSVFDRNPIKQRLFDQITCGHLTLKEGIRRYSDELNCDLVCCNDKTRGKFYKDYAKIELLPVFANVHEAFNSYFEMNAGIKRIKEQDFKSYITEKDYLNNAISKLDAVYNFNQKKLSTF